MYGCIVNGQLSVDRTDLVDGHKGVMMKMLIGDPMQQHTLNIKECLYNYTAHTSRTHTMYADPHVRPMSTLLRSYSMNFSHQCIGFQQNTGHHQEIAKFLECATIMRDLDHPNVSKVMNVSVEDNLAPLVLYPIVEYGNLHTFLTFCRVSPNESPLNVSTYVYMYVHASL